MHNTDFNELAQLTGAAILDPETSELLGLGATKYRGIALAERDLERAQSRACGHLSADDYRRLFELARDLEALQDAARSAFATRLGFVSGKPFTLDELRAGEAAGLAAVGDPCDPFVGLADYFRDTDGNPVGLVGHSRRAWNECHAFGVAHGLQADALEGSWRSPGAYIAVLYTRPGFVHLPKQQVAP